MGEPVRQTCLVTQLCKISSNATNFYFTSKVMTSCHDHVLGALTKYRGGLTQDIWDNEQFMVCLTKSSYFLSISGGFVA